MQFSKKRRLDDETQQEAQQSEVDARAEFSRHTAFSVRLLNMFQQHTGLDPLVMLADSNASSPPAHLRAEFIRKRRIAHQLHTIPSDCANSVLAFIHVPELCVLQRTSRAIMKTVKHSFRFSRAVSWRFRGDEDRLEWLGNIHSVCPTFKFAGWCKDWDVSWLWSKALRYEYIDHSKAIHALLDNTDIDPNRVCPEGKGLTALWFAAYHNNVDLVRRLLTYSDLDVNSRDKLRPTDVGISNSTPLLAAARRGHSDIVTLLLADPRCDVEARATRHSDFSDAFDSGSANKVSMLEEPVMHVAARWGHSCVVDTLLASSRVDPNQRNSIGATALHYVLLYRSEATTRALLACDRVDINARDNVDNTPLHYFTKHYALKKEVSYLRSEEKDDGGERDRMLLDLVCHHESIDLIARNDMGVSILMHAARMGDDRMVRELLCHDNVVAADRAGLDCEGNSVLIHLAQSDHHAKNPLACIDTLAESGHFDSLSNVLNTSGRAPLHYLLMRDACLKEVEAMLRFPNIDVNVQVEGDWWDDGYLDTPLHVAIRYVRPRHVELLLKVPEVNFWITNSDQHTALRLACKLTCLESRESELRLQIFESLLDSPVSLCLPACHPRMLHYVATKSMSMESGDYARAALQVLLKTPRPGIDTRMRASYGSQSKHLTALEYALEENPSSLYARHVTSIFEESPPKFDTAQDKLDKYTVCCINPQCIFNQD